MIDNNQIKALNLRIDFMKCLINNEAINIDLVSDFLQLNEYSAKGTLSKADAFFEFVLNTLVDNNIKVMPNNIDFKSIFKSLYPEGEDAIIDFIVNFLTFHIEDDIDLPINERLGNLLALEYENVPDASTVKRLYYYHALTLALAQSPINFQLIEGLNEKLRKTLE